jgi:hypothetical protein
MSTPASQLMLRHTRIFARKSALRHASTTSEAAQAASDTAAKSRETMSNITSKASEGLTRVKSSAGPALSGAAQSVNKALSSIGGRTGRLIAFGSCKQFCLFHQTSLSSAHCAQPRILHKILRDQQISHIFGYPTYLDRFALDDCFSI